MIPQQQAKVESAAFKQDRGMTNGIVTLGQLESHLWEAANILRGPVDAADFKTYVFPLLFFKRRRKKILFINAVGEVTRERAQSFLTDDHIARVVSAYRDFVDVPGFARVASIEDIRAKDGNLSIPLYVASANVARQDQAGYQVGGAGGLERALGDWLQSSREVRRALDGLLGEDPPGGLPDNP